MMSDNEMQFVKLNNENKTEYLSLQVFSSQMGYIETPEGSLSDMESNAWNIPWEIDCIYVKNQMVGYFMHGQNKFGDVWLDRFMIDKNFQQEGYGKRALTKILEMLPLLYPKRRRILLSVEPENEVASKLYEKFGFRFTGDIEDGEAVMKLEE